MQQRKGKPNFNHLSSAIKPPDFHQATKHELTHKPAAKKVATPAAAKGGKAELVAQAIKKQNQTIFKPIFKPEIEEPDAILRVGKFVDAIVAFQGHAEEFGLAPDGSQPCAAGIYDVETYAMQEKPVLLAAPEVKPAELKKPEIKLQEQPKVRPLPTENRPPPTENLMDNIHRLTKELEGELVQLEGDRLFTSSEIPALYGRSAAVQEYLVGLLRDFGITISNWTISPDGRRSLMRYVIGSDRMADLDEIRRGTALAVAEFNRLKDAEQNAINLVNQAETERSKLLGELTAERMNGAKYKAVIRELQIQMAQVERQLASHEKKSDNTAPFIGTMPNSDGLEPVVLGSYVIINTGTKKHCLGPVHNYPPLVIDPKQVSLGRTCRVGLSEAYRFSSLQDAMLFLERVTNHIDKLPANSGIDAKRILKYRVGSISVAWV